MNASSRDQALHHARPEVLDQDVGALDERRAMASPSRCLRSTVAWVRRQEESADAVQVEALPDQLRSQSVPPGGYDLDHVRAEVAMN